MQLSRSSSKSLQYRYGSGMQAAQVFLPILACGAYLDTAIAIERYTFGLMGRTSLFRQSPVIKWLMSRCFWTYTVQGEEPPQWKNQERSIPSSRTWRIRDTTWQGSHTQRLSSNTGPVLRTDGCTSVPNRQSLMTIIDWDLSMNTAPRSVEGVSWLILASYNRLKVVSRFPQTSV